MHAKVHMRGCWSKLDRDFWIWVGSLAFLHLGICLFLYRGILVPCGDSEYYLALSDVWGGVGADRPSGFSLVLHVLRVMAGWLAIDFSLFAILFVHGTAVVCLSVAAAAAIRGLGRPQARLILALLGIAFFFPLALMFHSSALMPDSIALCFTLVSLCILASPTASPAALAGVAVALGGLFIVRNGQFALSSFLGIALLVKAWRRGRFLLALACGAALAVIPIWYNAALVQPIAGHADFAFVGGRTMVAHIIPYLDCEKLAHLAVSERDKEILEKECRPDDIAREEWRNIWEDSGLLARLDRASGLGRWAANARYQSWALRALFLFPRAYWESGVSTFVAALEAPVSYNFKMLQHPSVPGCSLFPGRLWGQSLGEYLLGWQAYQQRNHALFSIFDGLMAACATGLNLLSFLFLLWPLLPRWGWPTFRHEGGGRLAHGTALLSCLILLYGNYYYSRHMLFFMQLSFFQFCMFLAANLRRPRWNLGK